MAELCLRTIKARSYVTCVRFTHDGNTIASSLWDGTIKLWKISTGTCILALEGHTAAVEEITFNPDESQLASASHDRNVRIWDMKTGNCVHTLEGHEDRVYSVAFSAHQPYVASAANDETIRIWDLTENAPHVRTIDEHTDGVHSVIFSQNGGQIISGSWDGMVKIWGVNGQLISRIRVAYPVDNIVLSPDGNLLATAGQNKTANIWNIATGECVKDLVGRDGHYTVTIAFSHDGKLIATGSGDEARIWNFNTGECIKTFKGHDHSINSIVFKSDDTLLATASFDKTIKFWNACFGTSIPKSPAERLDNHFKEGKGRLFRYEDTEVQQISMLLGQINPRWSKIPRTYIIARIIDCLNVVDTFVDQGFSDHWFPVTEKTLPQQLRPSSRSEFVAFQHLVMTKSMDLEKGENGQHCYFDQGESFPFETKGVLGTGAFGQVDRVLSLVSYKEYARKRVPRTKLFSGRQAEDFKRFIAEIELLKRLKHPHIVEFVGSYSDPKFLGLIMLPIAEMDLSTYLDRADASKHSELRTFFGCLTRALEFLHANHVRHKDIKPGNILVHGGNVIFTDFGLSLDFADADSSTTVSMVNGMTPRYCSPEVANFEPRNTSSDIWSLGAVFLEMAAILKGEKVDYVYKFLKNNGSEHANVRINMEGYLNLLLQLKTMGSPDDNVVLMWVEQMLVIQQGLRPTASTLISKIATAAGEGSGKGVFCGICCLDYDDFDDALDEFEDLTVLQS
ncbi:WD40-repeat-containing domain protein [Pyrenochaeta sp. MPI-SDFR-AT-0127]|nr:WD40-repeat-containing domain protein [Pyrenochaeta sp. MPI-SDFR-AT-0127]